MRITSQKYGNGNSDVTEAEYSAAGSSDSVNSAVQASEDFRCNFEIIFSDSVMFCYYCINYIEGNN